MKIKDIELVYTVDGTEQEVRNFKQEMQEKYDEVNVYPTPYDDRVVCKYPLDLNGDKIDELTS